MTPTTPLILVVTGLNREAGIAAGPGLLVVAGGGATATLRARLATVDPRTICAVVSFGIAGALDPALRVGDVVVPGRVLAGEEAWTCSPDLREAWLARVDARPGDIAGVDAPVLDVAGKTALRGRTGAAAVDMESHAAAAYAAMHGLTFAALRIVSDAADRALPEVAGRAMRPDGSVDVLGVLRGLARDPSQIGPLVATARDAAVAFRRLRGVRGLLGPRLGLHL